MGKAKKIDKRMQKDIDKLKEPETGQKDVPENKADQNQQESAKEHSGRGKDLTVEETKIGLTCVFKKEDCKLMGIAMDTKTKDAIKTIRERLNLPK